MSELAAIFFNKNKIKKQQKNYIAVVDVLSIHRKEK